MENTNFDLLYDRLESRWNCNYLIKKYIHHDKFNAIKKLINPSWKILDVGRGGSVDGVLGVLLANEGYNITISNVDDLHLKVIKKFAKKLNVNNIDYVISNPENMVFNDNSFDLVISLHTLEHAKDFNKGISEIYRVTNKYAIIALPTCLNPCVAVRLGGGEYYKHNINNLKSFFKGNTKILNSIIKKQDFVPENMIEISTPIIHKWYFPKQMRKILNKHFYIIKFGADCLCFPSFDCLTKLSNILGN